MIDLLLDPDKALDAVNKAVALVKKASKTVENVESLGPVLGKYFDAKATAVAVASKAKAGGFGGSAMGKALELELAVEQAREFEKQVEALFFQSNKMDVWLRIKARAQQMELEAAKIAAAEKRKAAQKKKNQDEMIEIFVAVLLGGILLGIMGWGGYELIQFCSRGACGR